MLNDSSKTSEKGKGQRAKLAPSSQAPVAPDASRQATGELSPLPFALSPAKVPWNGWLGALYGIIVVYAAQFFVAFLLYSAGSFRHYTADQTQDWLSTVPMQFVFILLAEALTIAAIVWFIRMRGAKLRQIGFTGWRWKYIVWALCGFAVYFGVYVLLYSVIANYVTGINVNQGQDLGFTDVQGAWPLALTFVSLVVLPPIAEETIFRGFIYTGLRNKLRFVWAAVVTSILFASLHLEFGNGKPLLWIAAVDTFTLSMVLCFIREKTNSVFPGMLIHAIKNALAFLALYVFVH